MSANDEGEEEFGHCRIHNGSTKPRQANCQDIQADAFNFSLVGSFVSQLAAQPRDQTVNKLEAGQHLLGEAEFTQFLGLLDGVVEAFLDEG